MKFWSVREGRTYRLHRTEPASGDVDASIVSKTTHPVVGWGGAQSGRRSQSQDVARTRRDGRHLRRTARHSRPRPDRLRIRGPFHPDISCGFWPDPESVPATPPGGASHVHAARVSSQTEICFEVGFTSLGTFSRTFRAIVGESPMEYRRRATPVRVPSCFARAWLRPSSFGEECAGRDQ